MAKKLKPDDPEVEAHAVTPDQLTMRCIGLCEPPVAYVLPTPWPPAAAAPLAASTSKR